MIRLSSPPTLESRLWNSHILVRLVDVIIPAPAPDRSALRVRSEYSMFHSGCQLMLMDQLSESVASMDLQPVGWRWPRW